MRRARLPSLTALIGLSLVAGASRAWAHDNFRLMRDAIVASGGRMEAEGSLRAITVMGEAIGGSAENGDLTLQGGSQPTLQALPEGTMSIAVEGSLNELAASVVVNGVAASRQDEAFRATGVRLLEGPNTITVTATDFGSNRSEREVTVWLDTQPPARPTAADQPAVTAESTITLSGTKTAGTSLWINGVEVVLFNLLTTWSATVTLAEGDNYLSIVTQDEVDHRSTAATMTLVVDALPPVITVEAPAMTNLTPLLLSGSVDDHLTRVVVNGVEATRSGQGFEAAIPLVEGDNPVTITATSPNGYISTKTLVVTLGTIPTITAVQPSDGSFLVAGEAAQMSASATDKEGNPVEYQLWRDGALLVDWTSTATSAWTPTEEQLGVHTLEARARDGFGGEAAMQAEVFVLRKPIEPP